MKDTQLEKLKLRIPFDSDLVEYETYIQILKDLLEDSKYIAFEHIYPFSDYPENLEPRYYNWQIRACVELYNLADKSGITNYSENGISWSKLSDGLSSQLLNSLTSKVGIPKSSETESDDNV